MTAFVWQTLALLGIAYLAGCLLGCTLRRMLGASAGLANAQPEAVPAQPVFDAPSTRPVADPIAPMPPVGSTPVGPPPRAMPVRDAFRRADTLEPVPKVEPSSEPAASRFERALSGTQQKPASPQPPVAPAQRERPAVPPRPVSPPPAPEGAKRQSASTAVAGSTGAAALVAAAAAKAREIADAAIPPPLPPVPPAVARAPAAPAAAPPPVAAPLGAPAPQIAPDDLTRIRGIDAPTAAALARLGIRRFAEITRWRPQDVARVNRELGVKGRVEQENWIEQAEILARGGDTHYSRRLARGERVATQPVAAMNVQRPQAAATLPPNAPPTDPARSRAGADAAAAAPIVRSTVTPRVAAPAPAAPSQAAPSRAPEPSRPAQPAPGSTTSPDVADRAAFATRHPATAVPEPAQAQPTVPAVAATAARPLTQQPAPTGPLAPQQQALAAPRPATMPGPVTSAASSAIAAAAAAAAASGAGAAAAMVPRVPLPPRAPGLPAATPQPHAAASGRPAIGSGRDSLQRIGGINAEIERVLNAQGVTRYSQIANWSRADLERFDRLLGQRGRIQRENWVEQAQILSKGGHTAYSRSQDERAAIAREVAARADTPSETLAANGAPPATGDAVQPARANDLSSLRSVRSEAFRPAEGGAAPPIHGAGEPMPGRPPRGGLDDLKRIRGVGVLIEKKLNSMGITRYDQIAAWSASDIDRVSEVLDFKGRIERENWVEQARILAAGGQTEFSRRVDRGEPI